MKILNSYHKKHVPMIHHIKGVNICRIYISSSIFNLTIWDYNTQKRISRLSVSFIYFLMKESANCHDQTETYRCEKCHYNVTLIILIPHLLLLPRLIRMYPLTNLDNLDKFSSHG